MQLGLSFSLLLASLLITLSSGVQAAPAKRGGMVTLPLKRIHQARDDIHPQIVRISPCLSCRCSHFAMLTSAVRDYSFFNNTSTVESNAMRA